MLEPPRSSAEAPYTPCFLCGGVFPVGSRRFAVLQQPRTIALHTYLVQKHPTHLASSVREGSVQSNHPELL